MPRRLTKKPNFVERLYNVLEDESTNHMIRWLDDGKGFSINKDNVDEFSKTVLPTLCNSDSICSLVRQLNAYSFKKLDDEPVFISTSDGFVRGKPELLKTVKRRRTLKRRAKVEEKEEEAEGEEPASTERRGAVKEEGEEDEEGVKGEGVGGSGEGGVRDVGALQALPLGSAETLVHSLDLLMDLTRQLGAIQSTIGGVVPASQMVDEALHRIDQFVAAQVGREEATKRERGRGSGGRGGGSGGEGVSTRSSTTTTTTTTTTTPPTLPIASSSSASLDPSALEYEIAQLSRVARYSLHSATQTSHPPSPTSSLAVDSALAHLRLAKFGDSDDEEGEEEEDYEPKSDFGPVLDDSLEPTGHAPFLHHIPALDSPIPSPLPGGKDWSKADAGEDDTAPASSSSASSASPHHATPTIGAEVLDILNEADFS